MKTYVAQIEVIAGNIQHNYKTMLDHIDKSRELNCHLIVFPEMCLPGYFIGDTLEQNQFLQTCEEYHKEIAKNSKNITVIFGSIGIDWDAKNEDGRIRLYNAAIVASNGKILTNKKTKLKFWPKTLLPNYRQFDDSRHFFDLRKLSFLTKKPIEKLYEPIKIKVEKKTYTVGISICEDAWGQDYNISPIEVFAKKYKHDLFINLSASPFSKNKQKKREKVFTALSNNIKLPIIYVNCIGIQNLSKNIYIFDGSSSVFLPESKMLNENFMFFKNDSFIFNLNDNGHYKTNINFEPENNSIEQIQISLEYGLQKICEQWHIKKIVLGLSGGIDSALSAVLFSRVLGPENVYCVNMPSNFNSELTQNNAKNLAAKLNCPYTQVPIQFFVDQRKKQIESVQFTKEDKNQNSENIQVNSFTYENIQARERGSGILAALAASTNTVYCCNVNKTELTVGYGTLYGDLTGFLCPIADLWKHEVYDLAKFYNEKVYGSEIISKQLFSVKPSAELSAAQDVTQNLGDPLIYEYHDKLFSAWVERWNRITLTDCLEFYKNKTLEQELNLPAGQLQKWFPHESDFTADLIKWWTLYTGAAVYKRVQSPPILCVSKRPLGLDHREFIR